MSTMKNKIVLVTGASAGIGKAICKRFSIEGARLIMMARRKNRLIEMEKSLNSPAISLQVDVQSKQEVEKAINSLPDEWKEIDILINNAGLSRGLEKIYEGNTDGWDEMIDTNIKGLLYVSRAVIPGMVTRKRGHIINIGSIAGHEVYPAGNVYSATKHAVRAISKSMLLDLVDTPIRVSSIDPGLAETEFSEVRFYGDRERAKTVYQGYEPLRAEDIAEAVLWSAMRPAHVQIAEMIILPTAQASAISVHKKS